MKKLLLLIFTLSFTVLINGQTPLTEAVDFQVETIDGETISLFTLLDDDKIVVIDFFFSTCGPCKEYAPDFQKAYTEFGKNKSNVFFIGINYGDINDGVHEFDSIFGLTFPTVSGYQGGGGTVIDDYEVDSYPTVIIITPDHQIAKQFIWPPSTTNIIAAVIDAGGKLVGVDDQVKTDANVTVYPNPVARKAFLRIDIPFAANVQYEIVDLLGNTIFSSDKQFMNKGSNKVELPVSDLMNGLYFVRLSTNNTDVITTRFILSR